MIPAPVTLLIVEDDEIDLMAMKRALKQLKITNPVLHAHDGVNALEILRGENGKEKLTRPYIILLDINMPRMNGIEFLGNLRADPDLKNSIVFVLTTSEADQDIIGAYNYNVAGYIVKSDAADSFLQAAKLLDFYWTIVALPKK